MITFIRQVFVFIVVFYQYFFFTSLKAIHMARFWKNPSTMLAMQSSISSAKEQVQALIQGRTIMAYHQGDWSLERFVLAIGHIYSDDVGNWAPDGFHAFLSEQRLSRVVLFDHPHDSDEECSVEILLQEDEPIAAWKRIGDHYEYYDGLAILHPYRCQRLADQVRALFAPENPQIQKPPEDFLAWAFEGNQYLSRVTGIPEYPLAYSLESPAWMLGRLDLRNEQLFVVEGATVEATETGTLTRGGALVGVAQIVETHRPADRWGGEVMRTTVLLMDGRTLTVPTSDLIVVPIHTS